MIMLTKLRKALLASILQEKTKVSLLESMLFSVARNGGLSSKSSLHLEFKKFLLAVKKSSLNMTIGVSPQMSWYMTEHR